LAELIRGPRLKLCSSLEEALEEASRSAVPGDVVLLSPASASYDTFRNYEERGKKFKELVSEL
ncbi:MAG: UDP-N-acetylmuramoyl-L-alanine--D-glutamate ligase, partial [Candidatus Latescibacterota bacterium]